VWLALDRKGANGSQRSHGGRAAVGQLLNVWCPLFMRTVGGLEPDFLHVHQKEPVAIFEKAKAGPDHARVDQHSPFLVVQCR
jgi:hypothetical protein